MKPPTPIQVFLSKTSFLRSVKRNLKYHVVAAVLSGGMNGLEE
jgi:hypothetical protein